jgi:predicted dehydrogenase
MEQKTTSVVMLGAGYIGQNHALSLRMSQFALGGGRVSPRLRCLIETPAGEASGKETANRFGFEEITTRDWTEVLSSTECDLFLNAGPNKAHVEPSIGFARAGKHVFCEKPLARTTDEAFRAWQEVAAGGVQHMCAFVHRFIPAIQLAREIIRAGELGDLLHYRSRFLLDMRNPSRAAHCGKHGLRGGLARVDPVEGNVGNVVAVKIPRVQVFGLVPDRHYVRTGLRARLDDRTRIAITRARFRSVKQTR